MSNHDTKPPKPLVAEYAWILIVGVFAAVVAGVYAWWTHHATGSVEVVGTVALIMLFLLCMLSGGYLVKLGREIEVRPEDDPNAEQDVAAGEYGHFAPWSWWPLVCGIAVALVFLGPALHQWWILGIGAVVGILGVAGHILEFNRGPHAH